MRHITALDGLRAVALLMVIAYHLDRDRVPAGFWGVMVFFVLAGYLITRLLCEEKDRDGRIDFRNFYLKRAFRLYPVGFSSRRLRNLGITAPQHCRAVL